MTSTTELTNESFNKLISINNWHNFTLKNHNFTLKNHNVSSLVDKFILTTINKYFQLILIGYIYNNQELFVKLYTAADVNSYKSNNVDIYMAKFKINENGDIDSWSIVKDVLADGLIHSGFIVLWEHID